MGAEPRGELPARQVSTGAERVSGLVCWAPMLGMYGVLVVWFFRFVAEDAYIVYRYATNLASGRGLTYNPGETVSALTSPLHALLCGGLEAVAGNVETTNRVLACLLLPAALIWAASSFHFNRWQARWLAALTLLSPLLVLWTVGGLETPWLAGLLLLCLACYHRLERSPSAGRRLQLSACLGLAFLARFDAALFLLPLLASALWGIPRLASGRRSAWLAAAQLSFPAITLAGAWLTFATSYYHDPLPTSYYTKLSGVDAAGLVYNSLYVAQFPLLTLTAPWAISRWLGRASAHRLRTPWLGLAAVAAYATQTATVHMMFAQRMLIPYLPVLAVLLLAGRPDAGESRPRDVSGERPLPLVRGRTATARGLWWAAVGWQLLLAVVLDRYSLNPGRIGEYRNESRQGYVQFMSTLDRQSQVIQRHWSGQGTPRSGPRVFTYAAGIVPFRIPEAYVIDGSLISYRHAYRGRSSGAKWSADYLLIMAPKHGTVSSQLGRRADSLQLVTSDSLNFDGQRQTLAVYFNPHPTAVRLPSRIDGPADPSRTRP